MSDLTIFLIIMLVISSPAWGTFLYVWIDFKIQEHRCPACKGQTAAILAIGPDLQALCHYHQIRRRIVERKENEVLGEWPSIK